MHHVPSPPLSDFVAVLWYFQGNQISNGKERVLPSGTADLIFRLDRSRPSDSGLQGPRSRSVVIQTDSKFELLGVHFKPGGAFPFLQFPVGELHNTGVSLGDLWGEQVAQELLSDLLDAPTVESKFHILEHWLMHLAGDRLKRHPAVTFAMRSFCSGPAGSVRNITEKTGYSQRYFIELFSNEVGLKPKHFHRLFRFRKVVEAVHHLTEVDWTDISHAAGYFDQAHLIHDFRDFSGLTPEQYLKFRTPLINHVREPEQGQNLTIQQ